MARRYPLALRPWADGAGGPYDLVMVPIGNASPSSR